MGYVKYLRSLEIVRALGPIRHTNELAFIMNSKT